MTADTMAALVSSRPLEMRISRVTAIRVMPDNGDQLVLPMDSLRMTPAIHTQSVPTAAIARPRPRPIFSVDNTAITASNIAAPTIATYSSLIGISSRDMAASDFAAFCMLRTALTIIGKARATPAIAPPMSMPIPTGRNSNRRRAFGSLVISPAAGSSGNMSRPESIGARNQ